MPKEEDKFHDLIIASTEVVLPGVIFYVLDYWSVFFMGGSSYGE